MLLKTHLLFSVFVWGILNYFLNMPVWIIIPILIATAFVDIDEKNSKMGKRWFFRPVQWISKHRGFFHSLIAAVLFSLIVGLLNLWAGFGFFVGYISHLFMDGITKMGVPLFWPFRIRITGPIKSGKLFEKVFFILLVFIDGVLIIKMVLNYLH